MEHLYYIRTYYKPKQASMSPDLFKLSTQNRAQGSQKPGTTIVEIEIRMDFLSIKEPYLKAETS